MKNNRKLNIIIFLPVMAALTVTLSGCEPIGDIFKAGIWVGIIIVIAVLAVIAFVVKMFKS